MFNIVERLRTSFLRDSVSIYPSGWSGTVSDRQDAQPSERSGLGTKPAVLKHAIKQISCTISYYIKVRFSFSHNQRTFCPLRERRTSTHNTLCNCGTFSYFSYMEWKIRSPSVGSDMVANNSSCIESSRWTRLRAILSKGAKWDWLQ